MLKALVNHTSEPTVQNRIAYSVLVVILFYYIYLGYSQTAIFNTDFLSFVHRAASIGTAPWPTVLVDGLYPLGYPFLLRAIFLLTGNYLTAGISISLIAAGISLFIYFKLLAKVVPFAYSLAGLVILGYNPIFSQYMRIEGTDAPSIACILASLYVIFLKELTPKRVFVAGCLLGLGYLFRTTTLVAVVSFGVYILVTYFLKPQKALTPLVLLAAGFLIISAPQWVASLVIKQNPFYNTQYWNVWYALYGNSQFWRVLVYPQRLSGLGELIADAGWQAVVKNFFVNLYRIVALDQFRLPFYFGWVLGLFSMLRALRLKELLPAFFLVLFSCALSIAFVTSRLALSLAPIELYFFLYLLAELDTDTRYKKLGSILLGLALLSAAIIATPTIKQNIQSAGTISQTEIISKELQKLGLASPSKVLSYSFDYYYTPSINFEQFSRPWLGSEVPTRSEEEVLWTMVNGGYEYVILPTLSVKEMNGFDTWFPTRSLAAFLDTVYINKEQVEVYALRKGKASTFRPATQTDWEVFTGTQFQALRFSWYTYQAILQEKQALPETLESFKTATLISAWRKYKGTHQLL